MVLVPFRGGWGVRLLGLGRAVLIPFAILCDGSYPFPWRTRLEIIETGQGVLIPKADSCTASTCLFLVEVRLDCFCHYMKRSLQRSPVI